MSERDAHVCSKERDAHICSDFSRDAEGWWWAACTCGNAFGPFPDPDIAVDAFGDHLWSRARQEVNAGA